VSFLACGLSFSVSSIEHETTVPRGRCSLPVFAPLASLSVHLAVVHALAAMPPRSLDEESAPIDAEMAAWLRSRETSALRTVAMQHDAFFAGPPSKTPGLGARHVGDSGRMGDAKSPVVERPTAGRYAVVGPPDAATLAAVRKGIESSTYLPLEELNAAIAHVPPGSSNETFGHDETSFEGLERADHDGDALGASGLGLTGDGGGGSGDLAGIGLDRIGDFGHGVGGTPVLDHAPHPIHHRVFACPTFVPPELSFSSALHPETVSRIVEAHHPELRACYDAARRRDRSLHGLVRVRFLIGTDGTVEAVAITESDVDDEELVRCTKRVFESMSFPDADTRTMVQYPLRYAVE
jgi:hypothetical protein